MFGIGNIFGSNAPAAPQAPAAAPAADPNAVPAAGAVPAEVTPPAPLDEFKGLWENDPNAAPTNQPATFNVDPAKLMEISRGIDFSKAVTPELMTAIQGGGDGAVQATMQAMNAMSQAVFAQSAQATAKLVEAAIQKAQGGMNTAIENGIKANAAKTGLLETNPALSHPAMAPIVGAVQQQIQRKYPNATGAEITQMANRYLTHAFSAIQPATPASSAGADNVDWSKFLD